MKPIPITSEEVINDAVRLSQSDFVSLYVEFGHDAQEARSSWFKVRASSKGKLLLQQLYGDKQNKVADFISDVKEEAGERVVEKQKKEKFSCKIKVGSRVEFEDRLSKVKLTGELLKLVIGTDGQEYAKIKRDGDGKLCLKKVKSITKL